MTKKILLNLLTVTLSLFAVSCDNDLNFSDLDSKQSILLSKYPNAQDIQWSKCTENKYDIAKFTLAQTRTSASALDTICMWFGNNNAIRLVKEEISFDKLPASVKASFLRTICRPAYSISNEALINSYYSDPQIWEIDDVYVIEKDGAISYRIEVETVSSIKPEVEMVLIYNNQGILLREFEAFDYDDVKPLEIPNYILQWVSDHFPNSIILDYEYDRDDDEIEHELDLAYQNIIVEVELSEVNGILTVEEIEYNFPNIDTLPLAVRDAVIEVIGLLDFFTIDDICEIEMEITKNGDEKYEIELRNGNKKYEFSIIRDSNGNILMK